MPLTPVAGMCGISGRLLRSVQRAEIVVAAGDEANAEASGVLRQVPYGAANERFGFGGQAIVGMLCIRPATALERKSCSVMPAWPLLLSRTNCRGERQQQTKHYRPQTNG